MGIIFSKNFVAKDTKKITDKEISQLIYKCIHLLMKGKLLSSGHERTTGRMKMGMRLCVYLLVYPMLFAVPENLCMFKYFFNGFS
uniref:Uncharacterized protein n=1 Tax=Tolypothrix bouteillei VB521301 TaxID=1479485 RepID=A0A0C1RMV2_9CYAN